MVRISPRTCFKFLHLIVGEEIQFFIVHFNDLGNDSIYCNELCNEKIFPDCNHKLRMTGSKAYISPLASPFDLVFKTSIASYSPDFKPSFDIFISYNILYVFYFCFFLLEKYNIYSQPEKLLQNLSLLWTCS